MKKKKKKLAKAHPGKIHFFERYDKRFLHLVIASADMVLMDADSADGPDAPAAVRTGPVASGEGTWSDSEAHPRSVVGTGGACGSPAWWLRLSPEATAPLLDGVSRYSVTSRGEWDLLPCRQGTGPDVGKPSSFAGASDFTGESG